MTKDFPVAGMERELDAARPKAKVWFRTQIESAMDGVTPEYRKYVLACFDDPNSYAVKLGIDRKRPRGYTARAWGDTPCYYVLEVGYALRTAHGSTRVTIRKDGTLNMEMLRDSLYGLAERNLRKKRSDSAKEANRDAWDAAGCPGKDRRHVGVEHTTAPGRYTVSYRDFAGTKITRTMNLDQIDPFISDVEAAVAALNEMLE